MSAIGFPSAYLNIYFSEAYLNTDHSVAPPPRRAVGKTETGARNLDASSQQLRNPGDDGVRVRQFFLAEPQHGISAGPFAEDVKARPRLTKGEMRCLALASHGLTSGEIAERSPYTVETVNSYLKSVARKLGASNRTHAVTQALRRKLIS